jgi:hypothetical protein
MFLVLMADYCSHFHQTFTKSIQLIQGLLQTKTFTFRALSPIGFKNLSLQMQVGTRLQNLSWRSKVHSMKEGLTVILTSVILLT